MSYHEDAGGPSAGDRHTPAADHPSPLDVLDVYLDERDAARSTAAAAIEQLMAADEVLDLLHAFYGNGVALPAPLELAIAEYRARWRL